MLNRSQSKVESILKAYKKVDRISNYKNQKVGLLVNTLPSEIITQNQDEYKAAIK